VTAALFWDVYTWLPLLLLLCNWQWAKWGRLAQRAVPGSLVHAEACRRRRFWRWWGFSYAPSWFPLGLHALVDAIAEGNSVGIAFFGFASLVWPLVIRSDYRKLRRELDEDDDDWTKRAGRWAKRKAAAAARAAVTAVAPKPVLVPAGA
jgi:hypothetical protein